jgi:superfamily II DNA helicase RecQ
MARARGIENIESDLTGNLERDFNIFIGAVLGDLSSRKPRFIDSIPNFKPFSKVYIGNRAQYAARALASTQSDIPQYVQGKLREKINQIFKEKKPKLGVAAFGTGVDYPSYNVRFRGGGIGQFADPQSVFVDYETP